MSKSLFSLLTVLVLGGQAMFAQSVEEGKKFYYYERFKSAKETLEKVLAANPNDIEAAYWLGQTLLEQKDSIAAKNLYQKLLQQNGNAPLLMISAVMRVSPPFSFSVFTFTTSISGRQAANAVKN